MWAVAGTCVSFVLFFCFAGRSALAKHYSKSESVKEAGAGFAKQSRRVRREAAAAVPRVVLSWRPRRIRATRALRSDLGGE